MQFTYMVIVIVAATEDWRVASRGPVRNHLALQSGLKAAKI